MGTAPIPWQCQHGALAGTRRRGLFTPPGGTTAAPDPCCCTRLTTLPSQSWGEDPGVWAPCCP